MGSISRRYLNRKFDFLLRGVVGNAIDNQLLKLDFLLQPRYVPQNTFLLSDYRCQRSARFFLSPLHKNALDYEFK